MASYIGCILIVCYMADYGAVDAAFRLSLPCETESGNGHALLRTVTSLLHHTPSMIGHLRMKCLDINYRVATSRFEFVKVSSQRNWLDEK